MMRSASGIAALLLLLAATPLFAQNEATFSEAEAADELSDISEYLELEEVDLEFLANSHSRVGKIEVAAAACAAESQTIRVRLEERFAPLKDVDPTAADVSEEMLQQRQEVRSALDDAIAHQAVCEGIVDASRMLLTRIEDRQNLMAQQFLSSRANTASDILTELPARIAAWPKNLRESFELPLVEGMTPKGLFWLLIIVGAVAAATGLIVRHGFAVRYAAAGGDDAPPQMKLLAPKPIAEFAPLWLEGAALLAVLLLCLQEPSTDMVIVRIPAAILAFGLGSVIINWITGPLSPASDVKGLLPDHVKPLRLRLRVFLVAMCGSYVVLGSHWMSARVLEPYVTGRAPMILLVGISVLAILVYLRRIPGLQRRYRAPRYLAIAVTLVGIVALFAGYQNLAGYLIQGVTRTLIALAVLWALLWLIYFGFTFIMNDESPAAAQARATLGIRGKGSGTGIGFMQLVADLVLWISVIVYLIYVWDNTGTTLSQLRDVILLGWTIGDVTLVPKNIVGSILIFAGLIVVVGWIKRWIDRRWLQHIVLERGAHDAILTLFGYVGFVGAILTALVLADVDLTGLAIISGALALGLGFGMQEIANNFVSGLILLFERPIRAGDFVTVGNVEGFVRSIRIRATEIETLDNQNVLVPNSELISGQVTNWVLRDTHGRLQVRVGVAYGSDIETVRDILERVGAEHPEVIMDGRAPAPRALFMGFGDSSLDFELRVRVQRIERRFSVMSDINFAIDQEFRKAGITIPFPQRDLHIVSYPEPARPEPQKKEPSATAMPSPTELMTRSHEEELETACSRDEVWAALTDIGDLKRWLVHGGSIEAQLGGHFELKFRDGSKTSGRLDIFTPPRRMRMVLAPRPNESPLPSGPITVDFILSGVPGKTTLNVSVAGIPANEDWEEYYRRSVDRWRDALPELKSDVLRK